MANGGSPYLPDLAKCLLGDQLVLSWDDILQSLLSHDTDLPSRITSLLADSHAATLLSASLPAFSPPTNDSRSAFDSKTAAINITPSSSQQYDIDKIKDNALWLSKETNVSELECLRLTVLEWQYQPELRLKAGFSNAELASLRDGFGDEYCEAVGLVPGSVLSRCDADFETADGTRVRILQLYFEEKVRLLAVAKEILKCRLLSEIEMERVRPWKARAAMLPEPPTNSLRQIIDDACRQLNDSISALQNPPQWPLAKQYHTQLIQSHATSNLQSIALTLDVLFLFVANSDEGISSEPLLQWLRLMQDVDHFASFQSDMALQQTIIEHIRSVSSCTTLTVLQPAATLVQLTNHTEPLQGCYIYENQCIADVHDVFVGFAMTSNIPASLAAFAWGLLLHEIRNLAAYMKDTSEARAMQKAIDRSSPQDRRSSISSASSSHQTVVEDILREIAPTGTGEDGADYLLNGVLQGTGVLDYMSQIALDAHRNPSVETSTIFRLLQDLIKQAVPALGYSPDLLSAQIAILARPRSDDRPPAIFDPLLNFIGDRFAMESLFDVAAARFPYETLPFLRLCKSLASATVVDEDGTQYIVFRLGRLDSFTQLAIHGFASYHTVREDENANLVTLDKPVGIIDFQGQKLLSYDNGHPDTLEVIPAQTLGEVISESMPPAIKWQHSYSGLALIGKWLQLHRLGMFVSVVSSFEDPDEVIAEVIWTINSLLKTTYGHTKSTRGQQEAQDLCDGILTEAGAELHGDTSIVNCIFELSEHRLESSRGQIPSLAGRDLLTACVDFLTIYSDIHPTRAWPFLLRSSIFGMGSTKRNALSVVGGVELPIQDFKLLESCSILFQSIVRVALLVSSQHAESHQLAQLKKGRQTASQKLNSLVVLTCTEMMHSAMEAIGAWAFRDPTQKHRITDNIMMGFHDILCYAFGIGETYSTLTIAKTPYCPAAAFLLQTLQDSGLHGSGPTLLCGQIVASTTELKFTNILGVPTAHTAFSVELIEILLGYSQIAESAANVFAAYMLSLLPLFIRLPLRQPHHTARFSQLIYSVLRATPADSNSSLLGHLGAASSMSMINYLQHAYKSSVSSSGSLLLWRILSRLVTIDQQWLAVVLLTGSPPGRTRKEGEAPKLQTQGKPCLQIALDLLSKPSNVDACVLVGALEFLIEAQRNWPSVSDSIAAQSELFPALISWVQKRDISSKHETDQALHNQVAAYVTDLAVLHLHGLMSLKDEKLFAVFIPFLAWLSENALEVAAYNTSLHNNLRKNFAMKYAMMDASMLKRSGLLRPPYGSDFFYDVNYADKLLDNDSYWKNARSGEQSFYAEFQRANVNLSIVDSELSLLRSLQYLCVEHAAFFSRNRDVARILARMISSCLRSNSVQAPTERLFDTLFQTRINLAITLMRPLVAVKARGSEYPALLSSAWEALRFRNGSYQTAIVNNDLEYWRSCLSILLMSLQFHAERKPKRSNVASSAVVEHKPFNSLFCEIAYKIVGEGLTSLVAALQAGRQDRTKVSLDNGGHHVGARDVSLLLNILQTIIRLPSLAQFSVQLSEALICSGAAQSCIVLYSWSHLLMENEEPVFAELAIRFLASLSSLTLVAEDLAVEGIFTRLLTAKVTQTLQSVPNGVSHLDKRPRGPLLYSVWSRGILPICLSLLHGVGGGVASEVSDFLNQFAAQLQRAALALSGAPSQAVEGGGMLTNGVAHELSTLSLISYILTMFREAGPSAGVDSGAISPLDDFDQYKRALAEDVRDAAQQDQANRKRRTVATDEREVGWQKSDLLDKKIVQQLKQALVCLRQDGGDDEK